MDTMEPTADEINELKSDIKALGALQRSATTDEGKMSYNAPIAEKEKRLNFYLESQQGKFASPISVVLSHSYR